jgi:hypothetical protein
MVDSWSDLLMRTRLVLSLVGQTILFTHAADVSRQGMRLHWEGS